jgi:hypothetical protein
MRGSTKLWVGVYGALFHLVVAAVVAWVGHRNQAGIPAVFYLKAVPPFVLSGFLVYALVVGAYVPRRAPGRATFLTDSVIGMLAELSVIVLTTLLYAFGSSLPALREAGVGAYLGTLGNTAFFATMWAFGSFFLQILVVGNAAGLLGWLVLKKLAERRARIA